MTMATNADSSDPKLDPGVYTLSCGQAESHLIVTPSQKRQLIDADQGKIVDELKPDLVAETEENQQQNRIDELEEENQELEEEIQELKAQLSNAETESNRSTNDMSQSYTESDNSEVGTDAWGRTQEKSESWGSQLANSVPDREDEQEKKTSESNEKNIDGSQYRNRSRRKK